MAPTATTALPELVSTFGCFGSDCTVIISTDDPYGERELATARAQLEVWHRRFSRFEPDSELSRLNASGDQTVRVSGLMARFAEAVIAAGRLTGSLVDATLVDQIEQAGYAGTLPDPIGLTQALALAPARLPAQPARNAGWKRIRVERSHNAITRPPGLKLDSGGVAKGLFADLLAHSLARHQSFAVDCGGDIRLGGRDGVVRPVQVASPFDASIVHTFELADAAIATSGIGKRAWLDRAGRPAHHLLDPATGAPAFTGIVQVTAIAPTGAIAEALSKAALLAGPEAAPFWLQRGGAIVFDDGTDQVLEPR